jgi:hypothetical protein
MSNLIINNLILDNIIIKETNAKFILKYNFQTFKIWGVSVLINNTNLIYENNNFFLKLKDKNTIDQINNIDDHLCNFINNYKKILNNDLIHLTDNFYIKKLYHKNLTDFILTIKCIKKKDTNIPIIHINERRFKINC